MVTSSEGDVVHGIYNRLRFKWSIFVVLVSILSSIILAFLFGLYFILQDDQILLILFIVILVTGLGTLVITTFANHSVVIDYNDLPSTNAIDALDLLFETSESLQTKMRDQVEIDKKTPVLFLLSFGLVDFIIAVAAYIFIGQPWSLYVSGSAAIAISILIIQFVVLQRFKIEVLPNTLEDWRAEYLLKWKITEEDWRKYREDFHRFNTLSITQVEIYKQYLAIARGMSERPSVNQIKKLVSTFPNQVSLNDALTKGYLDYHSYLTGEQMGCPGSYAYEMCIAKGFNNYDEFLQAKAGGFIDMETMVEAYALECENFAQLQEMRSRGFKDIPFSKYREIRSMGFENFDDYSKASKSGFPNVKTWLLAKIHGIPSYEVMQAMIKYGVILDPELSEEGSLIYEEYLHALENGFPNYRTYINAGARGFNTFSEMSEAEKLGFQTMEEWSLAISRGFVNRADQDHAKNLGFESNEELKDAQSRGCSNMDEYRTLIDSGYHTWEDLREAKERGFSSPDQFYTARKVHAPDMKLYAQIMQGGFDSLVEMREAYALGYFTKEEYELGKSKGVPDAIAMEEMDDKGFPNFEMFTKAKAAGFETLQDYQKALNVGAPDFESYQLMLHGGFEDYSRYTLAIKQGYKDRKSFDEGGKLGAKKYDEYLVLKRENKLRQDYINEQMSKFSKLQDNYIKIVDAYQTLDNLRSKKPNDFYTLQKVVEVLDGIHSTLLYDITILKEYNDVFDELHQNYNQLRTRLDELFNLVEKDLTRRRVEYQPIREFLFSINKYNVPAIIPLTNYRQLIEKFSITFSQLRDLVSKYFKDEILFDLDDMIVTYVQWIASPDEKKKIKNEIENKLSSLERGSSIGLGKVREMVEFKGTPHQFEELVNEVLPPDGSLGMVRYDLGIIELPSVDYYKEKYSFGQVKDKIKNLIENTVLNSKVAINIMAISSNISNKPPTPTFRRALKEVLGDFPTLSYNEDSGVITPPIGMIGEECPICFGKIESGERVGVCPNCKGQTHYNELVPWVLDNKRCPQCQAEINMENVTSLIA